MITIHMHLITDIYVGLYGIQIIIVNNLSLLSILHANELIRLNFIDLFHNQKIMSKQIKNGLCPQ